MPQFITALKGEVSLRGGVMNILKEEQVKYTKEQRKALGVFAEYIFCDNPYKSMSKRTYNKLGKYYKQLPSTVFSIPKCSYLYHTSRAERTPDKLTDSGIVSCTSPKGKGYISSEWFLRKGDIWWRLRKRKAVDAHKLYDVACEAGLLKEEPWLRARVNNEDEYILPQEKVKVLSRKEV